MKQYFGLLLFVYRIWGVGFYPAKPCDRREVFAIKNMACFMTTQK